MRKPKAPVEREPVGWEHYSLWRRVHEALLALPGYFRTTTTIEGMLASDIFTLNAALGATIEDQVVASLNSMRAMWDPHGEYQTYSFVRQAQTFPDVLLRKRTDGHTVLLGIELKGWYLLAKEGMPNFRFVVTPAACAPWDMLMVVPWVLSNVLSGCPVVYPPFIKLARYAAEKRNYYWQHERTAKSDNGIVVAGGISPYPRKSDQICDKPVSDDGGNFGRIARYGIMDEYVAETMAIPLRGVPAMDWLSFFRKHARDSSD